ncbi:FAD-dependent oxidoreductase [Candidatus Woesearchaeota archaeon]|nr:FAD-dependent oxidoreductase [Candidatus Woesearchaeota archaeon]
MAEDKLYDLIIIGAGPAGMTAGIYAARYKVDCLIIGSDVGGTAGTAHDIENWPGLKGPGWEIMEKFSEHVKSFGVPIMTESVKDIAKDDNIFTVTTGKGKYRSRTIILAMGTVRRKLNVPGEDVLFGKGVSYCATCDCVFFKDKVVGVVGGSDAAAMAAQILSQHAGKVMIIYRKEKMRCEPARLEELENDPKVEFHYNATPTEIIGKDNVEKVKLDTGEELALDGLFIEVGGVPVTAAAKDLGVELAENGRIKVDAGMATNVKGIFAAGDITTGSNEYNQIVTAAAEGAIAALGCFNIVRKQKVSKER